jgi:hypothetical protein
MPRLTADDTRCTIRPAIPRAHFGGLNRKDSSNDGRMLRQNLLQG